MYDPSAGSRTEPEPTRAPASAADAAAAPPERREPPEPREPAERRGPARRRLPPAFALALLLAVALAAAGSLLVGSRDIAPAEIAAALAGTSDSANATVITSQRLPRTLLAVLAGAGLGIAGALMQGHTRNPLADPGLFGVNAGATFGVAVLTFAFHVNAPSGTVVAALVGAGATSALILVLGLGSMRRGAVVMLAILGTTLTALLTALTSALVLLDQQTLDVLRFWQVGAVNNRDLRLAPVLLAAGALGLVLALANAFSLNALALGDDVAHALGTRIRRARVTGIAAVTLLAGTATAVCGPIAFVGLAAPHAARAITRHDYRWLVPCAGLIGGALLTVSDTAGRLLGGRGELRAGVVVVAFGAPLLLALTRRRRLVAL